MRIGVCTSPEGLPAAAEGLAFLEPTVAGLLCPKQGEAAFAHRLAAANRAAAPVEAVNCLIPGEMKTTGPAVDAAALDAYIEVVCRRAARAGVKRIVFGSGGSRKVPDGFDREEAFEQLAGHLKRWGPIAARHDAVLVVEPLNLSETNIVNTVDEGAELARRAGHPNVLLLADTYHMARDGDPPEAIRRAGELIAHVHCAEGAGRVPVGFGGEDHRPYFRALKDIGYDQRIAIEAQWQDLPAELPRAVELLREQIETA